MELLDMTYEQLNEIDANATDIRFYLARKGKILEREGASESEIAECAEDCSSAAGIEATIQCGDQLCNDEYQEYLRLLQKYKDELGS